MPNIRRTFFRFFCLAVICFLSLAVPSAIYRHRLPLVASSYGSSKSLTGTLNAVIRDAVKNRQARRGSGLLLDANSGKIIAATTVTADASEKDVSDMNTQAAWEPGSVMKPLLIAAAINEGAVNPSTTSFPNDATLIDGFLFTNAVPYDASRFTLQDILSYSINTGAVKVLKSLSKHNTVDLQSRSTWYEYLTNHYRFGKPTGINMVYEDKGFVAPPNAGSDINFRYGNMAIGQDLTVTPLQLASAYASILNGGTYYQPYIGDTKKSTVLEQNIVGKQDSADIRQMLQKSYAFNRPADEHEGLVIGGKSGTAHAVNLSSQYTSARDNGTFIGYISHGSRMMILLVRLDEPMTKTFASHEAGDAWAKFVRETSAELLTHSN